MSCKVLYIRHRCDSSYFISSFISTSGMTNRITAIDIYNISYSLPKFSNISSFTFNRLHWLPLSARIKFRILALVLKSKLGVAPKYLWDHIRSPLSATSHHSALLPPLGFPLECPPFHSSLNLAVCISFSILKTYFYSWGFRTGSATEWCLP